jgi:hypothetical protein
MSWFGLVFFFEVNWLHGLDQATTNLLRKRSLEKMGQPVLTPTPQLSSLDFF